MKNFIHSILLFPKLIQGAKVLFTFMKGFPEPENVDRSEQTNISFISCMTGIAFIIEQQISKRDDSDNFKA